MLTPCGAHDRPEEFIEDYEERSSVTYGPCPICREMSLVRMGPPLTAEDRRVIARWDALMEYAMKDAEL